jgi:hypothetical protein
MCLIVGVIVMENKNYMVFIGMVRALSRFLQAIGVEIFF